MGSHPPGIGKRSGTVFRGGEKDRSPRGGRGIAESWPLEWQGVDARSLEVVSPSLEASRQKRATRVRESTLKCLGHHSHHREEEAAWGWKGSRVTNCPGLPEPEPILALKVLCPEVPPFLGTPGCLVTLWGRRLGQGGKLHL